MATMCPKCKEGTLKVGEKMVRCSGYEPEKDAQGVWHNKGNCDFRIPFENKLFGKITKEQVKELIEGKTIKNKKGDTMVMDLENQYLVKIEFHKVEETDL